MKPLMLKQTRQESRLALLLVIPVVAYMLVVMLLPLAWGLWISFTDKRIGAEANFTGLQNYIDLLQKKDFWVSLGNTLVYTAGAIAGKVFFGVIMALLLNMEFRGRNLVRALLLIPWTLPNIIAVLNWKWIYADTGGVLNSLLRMLGFIDKDILWFGSGGLAMFAVIVANVWRGTPFFGISILSKLQTIPSDLYEAADIDGASSIQRFFHITLPQIKDIVLLSTLVSTIWTVNEFESVWLMTGGGPLNKTELISVFSYKTAMQSMQLGKAIAISVLMMPLLIILIGRITKLSESE